MLVCKVNPVPRKNEILSFAHITHTHTQQQQRTNDNLQRDSHIRHRVSRSKQKTHIIGLVSLKLCVNFSCVFLLFNCHTVSHILSLKIVPSAVHSHKQFLFLV